MIRGNILDEAKILINGERQDTNGNPEDSFHTIALFWNAYLNAKFGEGPIELDQKDVAILMTLLKIGRETHQDKRDNLLDAAGYIGLAGDFQMTQLTMDDTYDEEEPICLKTYAPAPYGRFEPGT